MHQKRTLGGLQCPAGMQSGTVCMFMLKDHITLGKSIRCSG